MDVGKIIASDKTLEAVAAAVELAQSSVGRGYLGASEIGNECPRRLWYGFRDYSNVWFDVDTLYRFEDGHISEDTQAARLKMVCELETHDPVSGKQFGFAAVDGHFRGHCDGLIWKGLVEAPATPHVWEAKACGEAVYKKLLKLKQDHPEKDVLEQWNRVYWAQAQLYMHEFKMKRHYLTASTPGARQWTSVRTDYDEKAALFYLERAERIIASNNPPPRIAQNPSDFRCKWCSHTDVCFKEEPGQVGCRTCRHSYAGAKGTWVCELHSKVLDRDAQIDACGDHDYIP